MGYTLKIGNVETEELICEDGRYRVPLYIPNACHIQAPRDDESHGTNTFSAGYREWKDFATSCGLHDLFYDDNTGLLKPHPGVAALEREHLTAIGCARTYLMRQSERNQRINSVPLNWLEYWVRWALDNCERPAIKNT